MCGLIFSCPLVFAHPSDPSVPLGLKDSGLAAGSLLLRLPVHTDPGRLPGRSLRRERLPGCGRAGHGRPHPAHAPGCAAGVLLAVCAASAGGIWRGGRRGDALRVPSNHSLINALTVLQGVTFPAMMAMWARWAPPLERSRLMTLSGSGANFGAFLALPLTGFICQALGWPAVFYICGE